VIPGSGAAGGDVAGGGAKILSRSLLALLKQGKCRHLPVLFVPQIKSIFIIEFRIFYFPFPFASL